MGSLGLQYRLAVRNVLTHKVGSFVFGGIIAFGACLTVVGASLLDAVDTSMARSITSSFVGDLQVYAADAEDELTLFGGLLGGSQDIGIIRDFAVVRRALERVDNVDAVIPMGLQSCTDVPESPIDRAITRLRRAVATGADADVESIAVQLRAIAADIEAEIATRRQILSRVEQARIDEQLAVLERVRSDGFWKALRRGGEDELMYLDSKLAPLGRDGEILWMRNLGTDLARFPEHFDRFELVSGERVPANERGLLVSERFLENDSKNLVARMLDKLLEAAVHDHKRIADDPENRARAQQLPAQYRRITHELRPEDALGLERTLRTILPSVSGSLSDLVRAFLTVDDGNIRERHRLFYEHVAPKIRLYRVNVGDTVTLRSYTKSGYVKAINVKVFGAYRFRGLEKSALAGSRNLIDMRSFRELYGLMTEDKLAEVKDLRAAIGAREVSRDEAEDVLFGGGEARAASRGEDTSATPPRRPSEAPARVDVSDPAPSPAGEGDRAPEREMDQGIALNAAITLKDPLRAEQTRRDLVAAIAANRLNLQVTDWKTASGMVGQLMTVIRIVLYVAISIIFLVALAIINNSMVIATMQRTSEIGTMRALGARRRFVLRVFLLETMILGTFAGLAGAAVGSLVVGVLGRVGIPAGNDTMVFLFSGPRLYPAVELWNGALALAVILLVSVVSTIYPARLAARVPPEVAMQSGA